MNEDTVMENTETLTLGNWLLVTDIQNAQNTKDLRDHIQDDAYAFLDSLADASGLSASDYKIKLHGDLARSAGAALEAGTFRISVFYSVVERAVQIIYYRNAKENEVYSFSAAKLANPNLQLWFVDQCRELLKSH